MIRGDGKRPTRLKTTVFLIFVILASIGLRAALWTQKDTFRHDVGISVLAADQEYLLARPESWPAGLKDDVYFFSAPEYGNNEIGRQKLLELLSTHCGLEGVSDGYARRGRLHRLGGSQ